MKDKELQEWLHLLIEAKKLGLSIEQVRNFLEVHAIRFTENTGIHLQPE